MTLQPLNVLYDGDCGICSWSRTFAEARDVHQQLTFIPFQLADLDALSRGLTREQASRMAWAILPDGTRHGGARAVFEVLKRLSGLWRVVGRLGANPIISAIFTPPYRLIAAQRHHISAKLGMNACALPEQPQSNRQIGAFSPPREQL